MKRYEFVKSVTVEGRAFKAGDVIGERDVPAGSLDSCLRVGFVRELPPEPPKAPPPKK